MSLGVGLTYLEVQQGGVDWIALEHGELMPRVGGLAMGRAPKKQMPAGLRGSILSVI